MEDTYRLSAIQLRYDRAGEHLAYINKVLEVFDQGNPYPIPPYEDTDALPQHWVDLMGNTMPELSVAGYEITRDIRLPWILGVRVGEMLYNLRAVLDYLIYALTWHDTGRRPAGQHERRLQFPIEDRAEGFYRRRNSMLKGLTDEHVALVRRYQPYKRCKWTALLRDLSNADKHREIVVLAGAVDTYTGEWYRGLDEIPEAIRDRVRRASPDEMDVDLYATLDVVFMDGLPVGKTLQQLQSEVGKLLTRFRGEFQYPPVG